MSFARYLSVLSGVVASVCFFGSLFASLCFAESPKNAKFNVVEAREFRLVNEAGKVSAVLTHNSTKTGPVMVLLDNEGRKRLLLGHNEKITGIEISDKSGETRLSAKVSAEGDGMIYLATPNKKEKILITTFPDKGAILSLDNGTHRVGLFTKKNDGAKILLYENGNQLRGGLALVGGKPQLWLKGKTPKSGAVLMVENDDVPNLRMMDPSGKTRLVLAARKKGPGLFLFSERGKSLAALNYKNGIGSNLILRDENKQYAALLNARNDNGAGLMFANREGKPSLFMNHSAQSGTHLSLLDRLQRTRLMFGIDQKDNVINRLSHPGGSEVISMITSDGKPYSAISRRGVNMWSIPDTGASIPENTLPGVPGGGMNWDEILGGAVQ